MSRVSVVALVLVAGAGSAQAQVPGIQTWDAELTRTASNRSTCPDPAYIFKFSVSGATIKVARPNGAIDTGTVGADGTVKLSFNGDVGSVSVTGNALTRQLQMSSGSVRGCLWDLIPLTGAAAEKFQSWTATIQQISGNTSTCSSGNRGSVQARNKGLVAYGNFHRQNAAIFGVKLREDGSAEVDTQTSMGHSAYARVKVAPGSGPRIVQFVTYMNACGYRMLPDAPQFGPSVDAKRTGHDIGPGHAAP